MVQTLVNQNSSNLDTQQIEQQILQTQGSIQSDTARLEDYYFQKFKHAIIECPYLQGK
jgi:hypothetical protein